MSDAERKSIIEELKKLYCMELEVVMNYLANSIILDGVRAEEIKKALAADVTEELLHARQLGGRVPGSLELTFGQKTLQPPSSTTDVTAVIEGVLNAENQAIEQYYAVIKVCEGIDYVTQDLAIKLVADEETHRTLFNGYLKEYQNNS